MPSAKIMITIIQLTEDIPNIYFVILVIIFLCQTKNRSTSSVMKQHRFIFNHLNF